MEPVSVMEIACQEALAMAEASPVPISLADLGLSEADSAFDMSAMDMQLPYGSECDAFMAQWANSWTADGEDADYWAQCWQTEYQMPQLSAEYWDGWAAAMAGESEKSQPNPFVMASKRSTKEAAKPMLNSAPVLSGKQYAPENRRFHKTAMCSFFPKGLCTKGNNCTFAHAKDEIEDAPDLKKTAVCLRWKNGTCQYDAEECHFAHGATDLRTAAPGLAPPKSKIDKKSKPATRSTRKKGQDVLDMLNGWAETDTYQLDSEDGPMYFSLDEMMLIKLEARESKENGADEWNEETFGLGQVDDWDCSRRLPPRAASLTNESAENHVDAVISLPPGLVLHDDAVISFPPGLGCLYSKCSPPLSTTFGSEPDMSESDSRSEISGETKPIVSGIIVDEL